jgi:hypothetical protein
MSTLYEAWRPAVGERVRLVMRDETGAAIESGPTGTIVGVHPGEPQELYEIRYDGAPDAGPAREPQTHPASDLVPIGGQADRLEQPAQASRAPAAGSGPVWRPTVGDRVVPGGGRRAGTVTAVEQRGGETLCEVAYDHQPDEPEQPQRAWHSVRELNPIRDPSATVLDDSST